MNKSWTHKEELKLAQIYSTHDRDEICRQMKRTWQAIKTRAQIIGLKRTNRHVWTDQEIVLLRQMYADNRTDAVANILGISISSVYQKALALGIKKSEEFMQSENSGRANVLREKGKLYRFEKGHISWNKGKKMKVTGRMAETQFKKGLLPHNTKHDGAKSVRKDRSGRPYTYVRVSKAKWRMEHVMIWEQNHGPITNGMVVVFKDGNTMNVQLDNLEMINRGELMRRNTIHRYPPELISVIKANKKLIKTIEKNGKEQAE